MARRLRHVLKDHLHTSQFCGVPGNSILEAASLVRDAIAYSESSGPRLCVLTLDFQHAFDRVSITTSFKSYTDMASANGSSRGYTPYTKTPQPQFKLTGLWRAHAHPKFSAASLSIKYDIICTLPAPPSSHTRRQPAGHQTRPRYAEAPPPLPVVVYAYDVTVLVTQPGDFTIIHEAMRCYEKSTGSKLNSQKSKALPIVGWSQPATALGM